MAERDGGQSTGELESSGLGAPTLSDAAAAAESEIASFEALTASLRKIELTSEKGLLKATRKLNEAIAAQGRIAGCLPALLAAFSAAQRREQAAAELLEACAQQIQKRTAAVAALMQGLAALGQEAVGITVMLQSLGAAEHAADSANGGSDVGERLHAIFDRMDAAVLHARELHRRAVDEGVSDVARQADSLHQQIAAALTKLRLTTGQQLS